jgi:hypothetical protein
VYGEYVRRDTSDASAARRCSTTTNNFSYEEAAAICGCTMSAINSRVSRARVQLRAPMAGDGVALPDRTEKDDILNTFLQSRS